MAHPIILQDHSSSGGIMKQLFIILGLILVLAACSKVTPETLLETQATWQRVGAAVVSRGDAIPELALDSAGTPYVAWNEFGTDNAFVKVWNGLIWQRLGSRLNVNSDSYIISLDVAIDSGNHPVVAWSEFDRSAGRMLNVGMAQLGLGLVQI
jgi:hypothetical protein